MSRNLKHVLSTVAEIRDGQGGPERGATTEWRDELVEASDRYTERERMKTYYLRTCTKQNSCGMKHTLPRQKPQERRE